MDTSNPANLALLLSNAYREIDRLKDEVAKATQRADHSESVVQALTAQSGSAATTQQPDPVPTLRSLLTAAQRARDDAQARITSMSASWADVDRYLASLDARAAEARRNLSGTFAENGSQSHSPPAAFEAPRLPPPPVLGSRGPVYNTSPEGVSTSQHPYMHPSQRSPHTRGDSSDRVARPSKRPRNDTDDMPQSWENNRGRTGNGRMQDHAFPHPMSRAPEGEFMPLPDRSRRRSSPQHRARRRSRSAHSSHSLDEMSLNNAGPVPSMQIYHQGYPHQAPHSRPLSHQQPPPRHHQFVSPAANLTPLLQTHTFAPPVTGAPQKKAAYVPTSDTTGKRCCRQCGQPGRYKEGRCVEKWGPGPEGPGTVCDRCRKKLKRGEKKIQDADLAKANASSSSQATEVAAVDPPRGAGGTELLHNARLPVVTEDNTTSQQGSPIASTSAMASPSTGTRTESPVATSTHRGPPSPLTVHTETEKPDEKMPMDDAGVVLSADG